MNVLRIQDAAIDKHIVPAHVLFLNISNDCVTHYFSVMNVADTSPTAAPIYFTFRCPIYCCLLHQTNAEFAISANCYENMRKAVVLTVLSLLLAPVIRLKIEENHGKPRYSRQVLGTVYSSFCVHCRVSWSCPTPQSTCVSPRSAQVPSKLPELSLSALMWWAKNGVCRSW